MANAKSTPGPLKYEEWIEPSIIAILFYVVVVPCSIIFLIYKIADKLL